MKKFEILIMKCGSLQIIGRTSVIARDVDEARKIAEERFITPNMVNTFCGAQPLK